MGWPTRVGIWICLAAMAALGALEALCNEPLPGLHALPEATPSWVALVAGVLLGGAALATLVMRLGALLLAASWAVAAVFTLMAALRTPGELLGYVPVAETAAFAAFAIWRWNETRAFQVVRTVFGAMLVLFGAIHLMHREMIASLIPDWIPSAAYWPWLTGGGSVLAGLACLSGRAVAVAAGSVALMYASWLLLIHAPRLMADPASLFEWTFALTALALAGIALAIAGHAPVTTAVSSRPPHSAHEPS